MKKYQTGQIRNMVLMGHGGCGKTMLAEAMLFSVKAIDRFGKVDDGTSTMDYDSEEIKRKISLSTSIAPLEYRDHKINLLDTPGFFDFVGEVKGAIRAADAACIVACAVSGVEVGTEKAWQYAEEEKLARLIVINKMDRENANFNETYQALRDRFGKQIIPLQIPIGAAEKFKGVVDIIKNRAFVMEGGKVVEQPVPEDLSDAVEEYRMLLTESAAESDDDLLAKYLDGAELSQEEIVSGTRKGVISGRIVPVLATSSLKQSGVANLLDVIAQFLPSPVDRGESTGINPNTKADEKRRPVETEPFSALVFKTMADPFVGKLTLFRVLSGTFKSDSQVFNSSKGVAERIGQLFIVKGKSQEPASELSAGDIGAVAKLQETFTGHTLCDKDKPILYPAIEFPKPKLSLAVEPKAKGDEDKIGTGLARLMEEDPTFEVRKDAVTHEIVASGMGDLHIEVITSKLHKKFGVDVTLKTPKISYKETIKGNVKVEGKHKKQSGGRGQFGHVWIEMSPLPSGAGFEFVDKIFGGAVPRNYIPAVEKGLIETMERGVLAGYPVVDVRVALVDGSYHPVDSSEMAFKIAARLAFKKGFMEAKPILLEPIFSVVVHTPEEFMGDVIGDLNKKRGRILGMEPDGREQVVKALAPQAELMKYAIDLRSMTQGRADFTVAFDHFEEVPAQLAEGIIAEAKKHMTEDEE
ncbi:elongation factor G [Hydrogenispora ethanolica]|uniref:Elongation factor G n=1 Tax=Hydrogenispora ethanolica TaxID=1082276 RepID=A0A4R1QSM0_HYDET|nr:elongation factor G [Hydrogenispora ethanolica]TCL56477.1 elongation factor G [Hydrogenispora ethanolica]